MEKKCSYYRWSLYGLLFILLFFSKYYSQQSYTFTTCGATGSVGPTPLQVNNAYLATNLSGSVTVSGQGIQQFTIPVTSVYKVEARGAQGYGTFGGKGAIISGVFTLTAGQVLKIIVGQQGTAPVNGGVDQAGGGGGSFVLKANNQQMIIAGGGGGSWSTSLTTNSDGRSNGSAGPGMNGSANGAAGSAFSGGSNGGSGCGGGGYMGNGLGACGGLSFTNGGLGGSLYGQGGFGGGGGCSILNMRAAGGGGGICGGGGSEGIPGTFPEGGGGGSFNQGSDKVNVSGANSGDGVVIITDICFNVAVLPPYSIAPIICSGGSATLSAIAAGNYSWSTGATTSSIIVSPAITTTYTATATGASNCTDTKTLTVSVFTPTFNAPASPVNICAGQMHTMTASGANSYTWNSSSGGGFGPTWMGYAWQTATFTISASSTSLNLTCASTRTLLVNAMSSPTINLTPSTMSLCVNQPGTLTASGAWSYSWTTGDTTSAIVLNSPVPATLNLVVFGTTAPKCMSNVVIQVIVADCETVGTSGLAGSERFSVFPNPNAGDLTVFVNPLPADVSIEIYNNLGERVYRSPLKTTSTQINIKNYPPGIYMIKVIEGNYTQMQVKKIVKAP